MIYSRLLTSLGLSNWLVLAGLLVPHVSMADASAESNASSRAILLERLRSGEVDIRRIYAKDLAGPEPQMIARSSLLFPIEFKGLSLGMQEDALLDVRPKAQEQGGNAPIRELYDFVPGLLREKTSLGEWKDVTYYMRKKRLAAVLFTSAAFQSDEEKDLHAKSLCLAAMRTFSTRPDIKAGSSPFGDVNRATVIWKDDQQFVIITSHNLGKGDWVLLYMVGATAFWVDLTKHYRFSDLPTIEIESAVAEHFPFLGNLSTGANESSPEP